jgi:hypothetical protein
VRAVMAGQDVGELRGSRIRGRLRVGWRLDGGAGGFDGGLRHAYLARPSPQSRSGRHVRGSKRCGRRHGVYTGTRRRGRARSMHPALLAAPQIAEGVVERLQHGIVRRRAVGSHCSDARSERILAVDLLALPTVSQRVRGDHSCRAQGWASYERTHKTAVTRRGRLFMCVDTFDRMAARKARSRTDMASRFQCGSDDAISRRPCAASGLHLPNSQSQPHARREHLGGYTLRAAGGSLQCCRRARCLYAHRLLVKGCTGSCSVGKQSRRPTLLRTAPFPPAGRTCLASIHVCSGRHE